MKQKRKPPVVPLGSEIEKVYSNKYQCLLTKSTSYFDESSKDWLNVKIEQNLNKKKNEKESLSKR